MSIGMRVPARLPVRGGMEAQPVIGGSTFAENPEVFASRARLVWAADIDPGTIEAEAPSVSGGGNDAIDPADFAEWLSIVRTQDGREHIVITDGFRRIRLDVTAGSLGGGPVCLRYRLEGIASLRSRVLPLRRLLAFCDHRRFLPSLYPADTKMTRLVEMLRVHDGLVAGASLGDLTKVLYGSQPADACRSDSLRSRVRRLVREGGLMAAGGYRRLMRS